MTQQNWAAILEEAIIGRLIGTLIDEGYRLEISDQDGGGLFVYAVPDGGEKPEGGYTHWVRLVLGNGADVITDYSTNLEADLKPVNTFAAMFDD